MTIINDTYFIYPFFRKNRIILAEAHCSYFSLDFRLICSYFVLATTVNLQKGDNGGRMGDPYFWLESTKFLELQEISHFFHIYGIHILVSIFSSTNGASRILILNLILIVMNLFCSKILCIYLYLGISVSKSCHIAYNIFFELLTSSLVLF